MTEAENIKQFLSGNRRELISIRKLEKLSGLPDSTLNKFLRSERDLPDHHLQNIVRFLLLVGYQPITNDHQFL